MANPANMIQTAGVLAIFFKSVLNSFSAFFIVTLLKRLINFPIYIYIAIIFIPILPNVRLHFSKQFIFLIKVSIIKFTRLIQFVDMYQL